MTATMEVMTSGESKGLQRPYTLGTFQKRLNDFQDLIREITLQDVEATAEERRQMITETLRYDQFCDSIRALFGADIHNQDLKALYKKITTNPDAKIDWSELFGYLQSESEEQEHSVIDDSGVFMVSARRRVGEAAGDKKRRDTVQEIRYLAALDCYLTASQKGSLSLWNSKLKLLSCADINESAWVTGCDYLPGLRRVAACTERSIAIWDNRAKGKTQNVFTIKPMEHSPQCMVWVPHSVNTHEDSVLFGDDEGYVNLLTVASKDLTMKNTKGDKRYTQQFSVDPKKLTYPIRRRKLHDDWVVKVKYFPELHCFASCSPSSSSSFVLEEIQRLYDDGLIDWPLPKGNEYIAEDLIFREVRGVSIPKGVNAFDYCAKANVIATGGVDKVIRVWHPHIFSRPTGKLIGHLFTIVDIAINEKDQHIISLSTARVFRVWDIQTLSTIQVFTDNEERPGEKRIYSALFDNRHERLVTGSSVIDMWPLTRSVQDTMQVPHTHDRPITHVHYNKELRQVVTVCSESVIRVWEVDSGKQVHHVTMPHGEGQEVTALTFDATGYRLATAAQDGSVKVWDFGSGQEIKWHQIEKEDQGGAVVGLSYCQHHGQRCLAVTWNNKMQLLLDSNENFELVVIKDFSDVYNVTKEVPLSSLESFSKHKPLPDVTSQASSATNSRKRGSVSSLASLSVSRQDHLLSKHELVCMTTNDQFIAHGCGNGNIILWNLQTTSVDKLIDLPTNSGSQNGSGRKRNVQLVEEPGRVNALAFLTRKTKKLSSASTEETPTSDGNSANSNSSIINKDDEEADAADANEQKGSESQDGNEDKTGFVGEGDADEIKVEEVERVLQDQIYPTVLVAGYQDCTIRFWSLQGVLLKEAAATTKRQASPVTSLCFDEPCGVLVTGDSKGYLTIWDIGKFLETVQLETQGPVKQQLSWRAHLTKITSLSYLNSHQVIVSGSTDGSVRLWSSHQGRFLGFFGQTRPMNLMPSHQISVSPVLPYDITEGPLAPVKSMSAKQKIRVTKQLEYPLFFDHSKWQPFRRSAYLHHRTLAKEPEDKKFFGALAKPRPQKSLSISRSSTNAIRQGAVFASLPVYRVNTPERPSTPDINTDRPDSSADFFLPSNYKVGKARKLQNMAHN